MQTRMMLNGFLKQAHTAANSGISIASTLQVSISRCGNEGGVEIERTWVIEVISVLEGKLQVFRPMLPIEAILGYT